MKIECKKLFTFRAFQASKFYLKLGNRLRFVST